MIFRKAEAGEQDGILALYRAVSASPFSTWNDNAAKAVSS